MPIDLTKYGAQIMTQDQLNAASGPNGFNFTFNRTGGSTSQPQQSPTMSGGGFGGAAGSAGPGVRIKDEDYAGWTQQQYNRQMDAQQAKEMLRLQNQYALDRDRAAWNHQDQMRNSILSNLSAVGTWGTNAPPMPRIQIENMPMASQPSQVSRVAAPDLTAAQNAAFARAKDREGQMATGALTGLRSALGGRGLLGSGAEFRGTANVANKALGNLGEVNREQAIQGANAATRAAEMGYQGDIQQRGQDIQWAGQQNNQNMNLAKLQFDAQMAEREAVMRHNQSQEQFMQNLLLGLIRA
jgi:hypothetical protein